MAIIAVVVLSLLSVGGLIFAFAGGGSDQIHARVAAIGKNKTALPGAQATEDHNQQRRKNMTAILKELETRQSKQKVRPTLRRRIEQAGLRITPRTYWMLSGVSGLVAAGVSTLLVHKLYVGLPAGFAFAFGLPRWLLSFLKQRRQKAFTREFAPAIEAVVRSVKTGLPVHEALKLVGSEMAEPVGGEFRLLTESLKVGITMDEGIKRMYDRVGTPEVNFFGIVMAIQAKAGGNLSEALSNLAGVLRDRKRLINKIKALSSEAKAGAIIIGSMPPGVMVMVYITTPDYIKILFNYEIGNLLLMGCAVWMTLGIIVMKKMIAIKY